MKPKRRPSLRRPPCSSWLRPVCSASEGAELGHQVAVPRPRHKGPRQCQELRGMEAATQDNSSGTWRLGFLHLARQKAWILDHEEARGDIRRESAGAEAGVGAVVWLPLQFSQRIWGARLAEHRAWAPSAPGQSGRAPPQPRSSPGPSGHALLPSLAHEQWMVPLEASSSPRKGWFLIDPQAPPALRVTPSPRDSLMKKSGSVRP
ncbi:unnamed protein product [Rangifer tarandus platyrhynchus]|uniref:Uncharacterized protein n=2 Tax=Rangifer tarandus platyrhynchus TaxID=3082113 RepID=A0ABN8Z492_RANTA|nr:unnamed protein product [Rangifer tarandus platyrhynchus]CAI9705269.1 unnamed protein product [Rangifer tarandus platyrhynchus]